MNLDFSLCKSFLFQDCFVLLLVGVFSSSDSEVFSGTVLDLPNVFDGFDARVLFLTVANFFFFFLKSGSLRFLQFDSAFSRGVGGGQHAFQHCFGMEQEKKKQIPRSYGPFLNRVQESAIDHIAVRNKIKKTSDDSIKSN
ncbi:hypothetical protein MUK42_07967 [Musa troglodytarum]|uniref:Uncharacterized protein n=1 Tax=Musa troglodytarum TaxID=320322 RepID=A0A9E7HKR1_9LILI|nr:hypothetical protein MUK42_07967 [Musa troglodytarum]URE31923.1 hypothetical protein MUK42_07967 [Musa troglodytarum]